MKQGQKNNKQENKVVFMKDNSKHHKTSQRNKKQRQNEVGQDKQSLTSVELKVRQEQ